MRENHIKVLPSTEKNHRKENIFQQEQIGWRSRIVDDRMPESPEAIVELNGVPVMIKRNYTIITGAKKSRKSLLAAYLMSKIEGKLLIIDTEQSKYHTWKLRDRILQLKQDDSPIIVLNLRGLTIKEVKQYIMSALQEIRNIEVIMIDNLRDLLQDINSTAESYEVVKYLEVIMNTYDLGVLGVLHSNKGDGNMRGHIGTEIQNRAYMVIKTKLSINKKVSNVICDASRDGDFDSLNLSHNPVTGNPDIIEDVTVEEKKQRLRIVLGNRRFKRSELVVEMRAKFNSNSSQLSERKAKNVLNLAIENNWITKEGKARSPGVRYFLNRDAYT